MEKYLMGTYDIIVVGAGHAGCEAGLAAARMGKRTLMLSINLEAVDTRSRVPVYRRNRERASGEGN